MNQEVWIPIEKIMCRCRSSSITEFMRCETDNKATVNADECECFMDPEIRKLWKEDAIESQNVM